MTPVEKVKAAQPMRVECPQCLADIGMECVWKAKTVRRFHVRRHTALAASGFELPEVAQLPDELGKPVLYARHDPRRLGL